MILLLRQRHRRMFAVLGVMLPLLLVGGIVLRRNAPESEGLPPELTSQTVTFTATGYERSDLFEKWTVRVRLYRDHESGTVAVGLTAPKHFLKPDLMVYWSSVRPATSEALPPEAKLLGVLVSTTLTLPAEAGATDGCLILFSLANHEIVDVSKAVRLNASSN